MDKNQTGKFFVNIPGVKGLYSYRMHGNMKFTEYKEGEANREFFRDWFLNQDSKMVLANVSHGSSVTTICSSNFDHYEQVIETDALVTRDIPNLYLCMTFADCPPVFLFDPEKRVMAAVHGGWKPVMNNIIYNTFNKMISLGAKADRMRAAILPGINQECYQFGSREARKIFRLYKPFVKYFKKEDKCHVDLKGIIKFQLTEELGIPQENLEIFGECTCCQNDKFFSYRGEKMNPEFIRAGIAMLGLN